MGSDDFTSAIDLVADFAGTLSSLLGAVSAFAGSAESLG